MTENTRIRHRATGSESVNVTKRTAGSTEQDVKNQTDMVTTPLRSVECARVRVEGSVTTNTGDFNSVRVGVMIEMPCEPLESAIDATYDFVSKKVDALIQKEIDTAIGPV